LKAFEAGADVVCVVTCAGDECRYLEGDRRAEKRADYVRGLLDEIGLGGHRLLVFHPADAAQNDDKLARAGNHESPAAMRDMVAAGLALQPSPLRQEKAGV
jgi:coenzyme F420-reducing hydrogenase delta subunit